MHEIPEITVACDDVVVDEIRRRKPFLRPVHWTVVWRSVNNVDDRGVTILSRDMSAGAGAIDGKTFRFTINWRQDLRRRLMLSECDCLDQPSDCTHDAVDVASVIA